MNTKIEILEEVYEISPVVAALIKSDIKSDFDGEVPSNYFDTLEEQVMAQVEIDKQIQELSEIEFYPQKEYFASLEDRILNKIYEEKNETKDTVFKIYFKSVLKYAAILVILTGSVFVFKNQYLIDEGDGEVFDEAYIEYLKTNIDDVDINMLIQTDVATEEVLKEIPEYPAVRYDKILMDDEY